MFDSLDQNIESILINARFDSTLAVLVCPADSLARRANISLDQAQQLIASVAHQLATFNKLSTITPTQTSNTISTGDSEIDGLLGGGVRVGQLTEFGGESAAGKSNLAFQLALCSQLNQHLGGQQAGAIFISSEATFSSSRLRQLALGLLSRLPAQDQPNHSLANFTDNIHLLRTSDPEHLIQALEYAVPARIREIESQLAQSATQTDHEHLATGGKNTPLPIRLVIVDSIAAPLRGVHNHDFVARSKDLTTIGDLLRRLATVYSLAVVVINQVSGVFDRPYRPDAHFLASERQSQYFSGQSDEYQAGAALGMTWAKCVNTRVMMWRTPGRGNTKKMQLVFSPWAPRGGVEYVIEEDGLRSVRDKWEQEEVLLPSEE